MTFQSVLSNIREDTKRKIMAAYRMYGKGAIDKSQFLQLSSAFLGQSGAHAATLADLTVSLELTQLDREIVALKGVDAASKREGYATALETILDGEGDLTMKFSRLALNVPLEAAQVAFDDAVAISGKGWVRQLDADPCQLCRWWWREGRVWPASHPMPTHPGCECVARPVNRKENNDE